MKNRYSLSQISLHWATLLMIILTYTAMLTRDYFLEDNQPLVRLLHFNFGICVWLLMWVRVFLRTRYATPVITPPLPRWQIAASHAVHGVLYLLFLSLPVLGVLTLEFGGRDWVLFGWQVPQFVTPDPSVRSTVKQIHVFMANCGYYLIGLHALAAIYHHYFRKDDTHVTHDALTAGSPAENLPVTGGKISFHPACNAPRDVSLRSGYPPICAARV